MPVPDLKPCAAYGCDKQIKRGMLMCPRHWRQLSKERQEEILSTLAAWRAGLGSARNYINAVAQAQLAIATLEGQSLEVIAGLAYGPQSTEKGGN